MKTFSKNMVRKSVVLVASGSAVAALMGATVVSAASADQATDVVTTQDASATTINRPILTSVAVANGLVISKTSVLNVAGAGTPGDLVNVEVAGKLAATAIVGADGQYQSSVKGMRFGTNNVSVWFDRGSQGVSERNNFNFRVGALPAINAPTIKAPASAAVSGQDFTVTGIKGNGKNVFIEIEQPGQPTKTILADTRGRTWSAVISAPESAEAGTVFVRAYTKDLFGRQSAAQQIQVDVAGAQK